MGTHSGTFQADEALGIFLLRQLPKYKDASLTRSRDKDTLAPLEIVIDVAGLYDHSKLRYDHHQRGFFETFDGANEASCDGGRPDVTGADTATGKFKTKLSASGLVYKHYGRELLCVFYAPLKSSPESLEWVYNKMYVDFMEAIDGNDNGIEIADTMRYKENTTLPHRVHRLNKRWNAAPGGPSEDELFETASALCGTEFCEMLSYIVECELPAREIVEAALKERADVHPCGKVIRLPNSGCPWKTHLYELERKLSIDLVSFVLFADTAGMWRVQAVTQEGTEFSNRLSLLEPWCGLRDAELTAKTGIEGCKFVHMAGFTGGNATYEGALAMAIATIEASK